MSPIVALSLLSISKRFGATQALDGVDLTIARGEVVALMGANGAGKSTLAKIVAGVVKPDRGRILVAGREIRPQSPQAARQAGIVVVHQSTDQLGAPGLSVAENLLLDQLCGGGGAIVSRRRLFERAKPVADSVGLDAPLDLDFGALGPAHRQLVAIARAVAAEAAVLILDEPTASLSSGEADRLFAVVDRLRERGVAALYISHRLGDLRRIADRIVILRNGRRVAEQSKPFDFAAAVHAMIGRALGAAADVRAPNEASGEPMLLLTNAQLRPTARPFNLDIRAGEVIALVGALGAGKSRLLGALFGLTPLVRGEIELNGASWRPKDPADAIAKGVFMAGEDRWRSSLLPPLTPGGDIAGTIALPHRKSWFPWGVVSERREADAADRAIHSLGVRCRSARDTLDLLSGGNQQKVVIGRWRSAPCRLLLLDEPFQGVDVGARRDIVEALRAERRDGATLIATSDVEEAIEVADIVAVMRRHTIVGVHDMRASDGASLIAAIAALEAGGDNEEQGAAA